MALEVVLVIYQATFMDCFQRGGQVLGRCGLGSDDTDDKDRYSLFRGKDDPAPEKTQDVDPLAANCHRRRNPQ